ncbi:hypothetical protein CDAR_91501 [Caerostris darwini]|uniref:Uncharacterized protein n=1 Tax=Caerostris darwini TaxID=1538125 RepID=A0AAV4WCW6_9ARAC|nr:hypothetical protein CDAR_91501 [Caerostris darwini]
MDGEQRKGRHGPGRGDKMTRGHCLTPAIPDSDQERKRRQMMSLLPGPDPYLSSGKNVSKKMSSPWKVTHLGIVQPLLLPSFLPAITHEGLTLRFTGHSFLELIVKMTIKTGRTILMGNTDAKLPKQGFMSERLTSMSQHLRSHMLFHHLCCSRYGRPSIGIGDLAENWKLNDGREGHTLQKRNVDIKLRKRGFMSERLTSKPQNLQPYLLFLPSLGRVFMSTSGVSPDHQTTSHSSTLLRTLTFTSLGFIRWEKNWKLRREFIKPGPENVLVGIDSGRREAVNCH